MRQSGLKVQDKIKTALLYGAYSSGLYRVISRVAGGIGAVLMLHRIVQDKDETPSRYLTVTAGFLEDVILRFKKNGISFVSLDDMLHILRSRRGSRERFVALTFDDGYPGQSHPCFAHFPAASRSICSLCPERRSRSHHGCLVPSLGTHPYAVPAS